MEHSRSLPADLHVPRTGRIKCGTESNGGFKNITVSNCVFEGCNGIALESEDGALLEDVAFTNITMRDISGAPIFIRLGSRMRGPAGVPVGDCRRIIISNIVSYNSASKYSAIISGVPDHPIADLKISDVYLHHQGGGTAEMAALRPPENEAGYPDPHMFGPMPAHGFYIRHVNNIELTNVEVAYASPDARPGFVLDTVTDADLFRIKLPSDSHQPAFRLRKTSDFRIFGSPKIKDKEIATAESEEF